MTQLQRDVKLFVRNLGKINDPQHDHECVDPDPLLAELKYKMQQRILYRLQLVDRTSKHRILLGPEDLVQMIDFADPLQCPPREIGDTNTQFRRGNPHRPTLRLQML